MKTSDNIYHKKKELLRESTGTIYDKKMRAIAYNIDFTTGG